MTVAGLTKIPIETPPDAVLSQKQLSNVVGIVGWLLGDARKLDADPNAILAGLCERMNRIGIPVDRASSIVELRNAEAGAVSRTWEKGQAVRVHMFRGGSDPSDDYSASPFAVSHRDRCWVLSDLTALPSDHFPTLNDIRTDGYAQHLVVPVMLSNGMNNAFAFGTRTRDGLTPQHLTMICQIMPTLGALQEILVLHRILHEAMRMYVGDEPHRRILAGDTSLGDVSEQRAAILFADMRNFTGMTSDMTPAQTTALLNRYYDCVVPHVEAAGGEVLKLIADGVLAVFADDEAGDIGLCAQSLTAARNALAAIEQNADVDQPRFRAGIGLHIGQVAYGNVGSGQRLDYTIIGRDVNIGARIAGLCGPLDKQLLLSDRFAGLLSPQNRQSLEPVGTHSLKGVPQPVELFAHR